MSSHLALISISRYYEISDGYVFKLRQKCNNSENVFHKLPKYTYNTETNNLGYCNVYLQFAGMFEDENINKNKYLVFDIDIIDNELSEEISNNCIEEVFEKIDIKQMLSYFSPGSVEDMMYYSIPKQNYIIIELEYLTSRDWETGNIILDETISNLYGYLNDNMELVRFFNSQVNEI